MFAILPETMKKIDAQAVAYGIPAKTLMTNAAKALYRVVKKCMSGREKIVVLCGSGNNGGDGYALAFLLQSDYEQVICVNVFARPPCSPEGLLFFEKFTAAGGTLFEDTKNALSAVSEADIIVDGIFGTGFHGAVDKNSPARAVIAAANENIAAIRIAIDSPSGIRCADGRVLGEAFRADITVTLARAKPGLFSYPAKAFCGEVIIADIGIPDSVVNSFDSPYIITDDRYLYETIKERAADSHKGTYGTVLAFCGSPNMTGAPYLAAMGALRSGVGLYVIASDRETVKILQTRLSEPLFLPVDPDRDEALELLIERSKKAAAFLIGCGLGKTWRMSGMIHKLILECETGIILDADGINALSSNINVLKEAKKPAVLTPHPVEFSRICGKSVEEIQSDRINAAKAFAQEYRSILVLKGAATIIATPNGKVFINPTGNASLAKGGSGDVLAGVIASFYAQGFSPEDAAVCGVYVHGKAGDLLSDKISSYGVLPSDLPLEIGKLLP